MEQAAPISQIQPVTCNQATRNLELKKKYFRYPNTKKNAHNSKAKFELMRGGFKALKESSQNLRSQLRSVGNMTSICFTVAKSTCAKLEIQASRIYNDKLKALFSTAKTAQVSFDGSGVAKQSSINVYLFRFGFPDGSITDSLVGFPQVSPFAT